MGKSLFRRSLRIAVAAVAAAVVGPAVAQAKPTKAAAKTLIVCKHGCRYNTIQKAVNASGRDATINVKPGKYVEGVIVQGHPHDGLHIIGVGKKPSAVLIEGKNAKGPGGAAQNGIDGESVNNLDLENLKAEHFASNGFFINTCKGYLMKNLIAGFNHSYGLYAFKCVGGRMTQSLGYGNGDSAFYVGGTPFQKHPVKTLVDHDTGYKNVLGYSGTNSKYIVIRDCEFYNNGAGVVPNTLKSEPWEPATSGVIEDNLIYWNNFDYYRPGSPVKTVSSGFGPADIQYPIGVGVLLFGTTDWVVKHNSIFGNFLSGASSVSDPTNDTGKAENNRNQFIANKMGAAFHDPNGFDFFNDGSGRGTCFSHIGADVTVRSSTDKPNSQIYPTCPTTLGTGTVTADPSQFALISQVVTQKAGQEQFWKVHKHPKRAGRTPFEG